MMHWNNLYWNENKAFIYEWKCILGNNQLSNQIYLIINIQIKTELYKHLNCTQYQLFDNRIVSTPTWWNIIIKWWL